MLLVSLHVLKIVCDLRLIYFLPYQWFFFFFSVAYSQLLCGLENRFSVWLFDQIRSALYKQTYVQRVVLTPVMKNYASMTHVSKFVIGKW